MKELYSWYDLEGTLLFEIWKTAFEDETKFHNCILEMTQENETLKQKTILLENELFKLNRSSRYLPDKEHP